MKALRVKGMPRSVICFALEPSVATMRSFAIHATPRAGPGGAGHRAVAVEREEDHLAGRRLAMAALHVRVGGAGARRKLLGATLHDHALEHAHVISAPW